MVGKNVGTEAQTKKAAPNQDAIGRSEKQSRNKSLQVDSGKVARLGKRDIQAGGVSDADTYERQEAF